MTVLNPHTYVLYLSQFDNHIIATDRVLYTIISVTALYLSSIPIKFVIISLFYFVLHVDKYEDLMNDRNKTVATIASIVGIGLCCVLIKYRSKLYRQLRLLADFRNPLRYKTVKVVNDADECRQVLGNVKL